MIVCNKCGTPNPDDAMSCEECGHKLQSGFTDLDPSREDFFLSEGIPSRFWKKAGGGRGRYLESWLYALALLGATAALVFNRLDWPLYILAVAVLVLIRLRRL